MTFNNISESQIQDLVLGGSAICSLYSCATNIKKAFIGSDSAHARKQHWALAGQQKSYMSALSYRFSTFLGSDSLLRRCKYVIKAAFSGAASIVIYNLVINKSQEQRRAVDLDKQLTALTQSTDDLNDYTRTLVSTYIDDCYEQNLTKSIYKKVFECIISNVPTLQTEVERSTSLVSDCSTQRNTVEEQLNLTQDSLEAEQSITAEQSSSLTTAGSTIAVQQSTLSDSSRLKQKTDNELSSTQSQLSAEKSVTAEQSSTIVSEKSINSAHEQVSFDALAKTSKLREELSNLNSQSSSLIDNAQSTTNVRSEELANCRQNLEELTDENSKENSRLVSEMSSQKSQINELRSTISELTSNPSKPDKNNKK